MKEIAVNPVMDAANNFAVRARWVGKKLLQALIDEREKNNFWTLQAGIFPENEASIKMHQVCGFSIIGSREKIGK